MESGELSALRYEPLKESHIPRILEIEKESNSAPWSDRSFRNEITNPQSIFLAAALGSKIIGFGGVWLCVDEAHITTLAVDSAHRRKGIGKRLMLQLLSRSADEGMTCSTLEVRAGNSAAISLYRQIGYTTTAKRRAYYPDNREDALVMWLHDLQACLAA